MDFYVCVCWCFRGRAERGVELYTRAGGETDRSPCAPLSASHRLHAGGTQDKHTIQFSVTYFFE